MTGLAAEIVAAARLRGIDLTPLHGDGAALLINRGRGIFFFRREGAVGYNMQGPIAVLPTEFADSASAFYGMWHESGRLPNVERAAEFTNAWLAEYREVDQLPDADRERHRWGIG